MKKYLLGALALVLAIGFSAFTKPKSANILFTFDPSLSTRVAAGLAPDVDNWINSGASSLSCTSTEEAACQVLVPDTYVDINGDIDATQVYLDFDQVSYSGTLHFKVKAVKLISNNVDISQGFDNKPRIN